MNNQPMYMQIQQDLLKKINDGTFLPGEMIPSERQLAAQYQVSRLTVQNAVNALVEAGKLVRSKGKGTFVIKRNSGKFSWNSPNTMGLSAIFKERGIRKKDKVLISDEIPASPYLADKLSVPLHTPLFILTRIRCADDDSFAVEYSYLPLHYFPDIAEYDYAHVSLYAYMRSREHLPVSFRQKLIIIAADEKLAKQLSIPLGDPLYYFEFTGIDEAGNLVEYTESYIRCDKTTFIYEAMRDNTNAYMK